MGLRGALEQLEQFAFAAQLGLGPRLLNHADRVDRGPRERLVRMGDPSPTLRQMSTRASPAPVRSSGAAGSGYEGIRKRCVPSDALAPSWAVCDNDAFRPGPTQRDKQIGYVEVVVSSHLHRDPQNRTVGPGSHKPVHDRAIPSCATRSRIDECPGGGGPG